VRWLPEAQVELADVLEMREMAIFTPGDPE
jgi:hypothetical protein